MIEDPSDHDWVFDTGNHLDNAAALLTGFDTHLECALEALRPRHGGAVLGERFGFVGGSFTAPGRCPI